jgi:hypothetical protein
MLQLLNVSVLGSNDLNEGSNRPQAYRPGRCKGSNNLHLNDGQRI